MKLGTVRIRSVRNAEIFEWKLLSIMGPVPTKLDSWGVQDTHFVHLDVRGRVPVNIRQLIGTITPNSFVDKSNGEMT